MGFNSCDVSDKAEHILFNCNLSAFYLVTFMLRYKGARFSYEDMLFEICPILWFLDLTILVQCISYKILSELSICILARLIK